VVNSLATSPERYVMSLIAPGNWMTDLNLSLSPTQKYMIVKEIKFIEKCLRGFMYS
jgi:hypothetical protein